MAYKATLYAPKSLTVGIAPSLQSNEYTVKYAEFQVNRQKTPFLHNSGATARLCRGFDADDETQPKSAQRLSKYSAW